MDATQYAKTLNDVIKYRGGGALHIEDGKGSNITSIGNSSITSLVKYLSLNYALHVPQLSHSLLFVC